MGSKQWLLLLALALAGVYASAQEGQAPAQDSQEQANGAAQRPDDASQAEETAALPAASTADSPTASTPAATISADPSLVPDGRSPQLFVHSLEWTVAEYSVSYVVILEQNRDGQFVEVLRRTVQAPPLEVSIPSGEYRFRVFGFNVLGRPDVSTDWEYITIIQAMQPSIFSFSPANFYFDRKSLRVINLEGVNLIIGSQIYLLRRGGQTVVPDEENEESMYFENDILFPTEVRLTDLGDTAQLVFDEDSLVEGVFDIIVRNPGGFEGHAGPFGISVAKPWDLNVSLGYFPMVRMFESSEFILNTPGVPLGIGASVSFIPFKKNFGFIGAEINIAWAYFSSTTADGEYTIRSNLFSVHANALYQFWYKKDILAFNARLGLGISGLLGHQYEFHTGKLSDPMSFPFFSWGGGVSAMWLVWRQLFVEGGVSYHHVHDSEYPQGYMRFFLSGGWQF